MYDKGVLQSGTHWGYGLTDISSSPLAEEKRYHDLEFAAQRKHSGYKRQEEMQRKQRQEELAREQRQEDLQGQHELDRPETPPNATAVDRPVDRLKNILRQERAGGLWRSPLLQPSTSPCPLPIPLQEEAEGDHILLQEEAEGDANLLGEKTEEVREEEEVELDPDTMMPIHKGR